MSATNQSDANENSTTQGSPPEPTMFGPPDDKSQERATLAREAALDAIERALVASERLRTALPPKPLPQAPQLHEQDEQEKWPHGPLPDHLTRPRENPALPRRRRRSLDPVVIKEPPPEADTDRSTGTMLARTIPAVAVSAIVAVFAVGIIPLPASLTADGEAAAMSLWSRVFPSEGGEKATARDVSAAAAAPAAVAPAAAALTVAPREPLLERAVALRPQGEPSAPIVPQPVATERIVMAPSPAMALPAAAPPPAVAPPAQPPAPPVPAIDSEELATLHERSRKLIEQGDIASARLMLTRAAEAGDARAALGLGTTYDPEVLKKLGVLGVAADVARAQAWYTKAVELGLPEASLRLERLAQAVR